MINDRRPNPHDPTDERTSEQSTQSASGLRGGKRLRTDDAAEGDDLLNRDEEERYATPRRYEDGEDAQDSGAPRDRTPR